MQFGYRAPMSDTTDLIRVRRMVETGAARAIRLAAGLSLAEIARAADVTRATVWRWEAGERRPHGPAASRYLRVLEEIGR